MDLWMYILYSISVSYYYISFILGKCGTARNTDKKNVDYYMTWNHRCINTLAYIHHHHTQIHANTIAWGSVKERENCVDFMIFIFIFTKYQHLFDSFVSNVNVNVNWIYLKQKNTHTRHQVMQSEIEHEKTRRNYIFEYQNKSSEVRNFDCGEIIHIWPVTI